MRDFNRVSSFVVGLITVLLFSGPAGAESVGEQLLAELDEYPHAESIASTEAEVIDHEIGLGTLKKVRGVWQFKNSERHSGQLSRHTWQILDGFTSLEVLEDMVAKLEQSGRGELLFSCKGRACGSGAQWANRIFGQRILYGREDLQHYRVYKLGNGQEYRLIIYSAARSADRQYLHTDLLRLAD